MTDQELLQAIGQVVEAKLEPIRQEICGLKEDFQSLIGDVQVIQNKVEYLENTVNRLDAKVSGLENQMREMDDKLLSVRVCIDTDLSRTLSLLLEGQQALWDRFVPQEEYDSLEHRTEILELTAKRHSQEIRELRKLKFA